MLRKTHISSDSGNPTCCRLCVLVKGVTYYKKSLQEGKWRIAHCGRGCLWKIFASSWSLPQKETTTVYALWTAIKKLYSIQSLDHWKPKSRKGEKIYARFLEVSPRRRRPELCRVPDRMTLCGLHFAVLSDKLDLSSTERRLDREKYSFYCANKSLYMTPKVRENCALF